MSLAPEFAGLLDPKAYDHPVAAVECVETPISWVLLAGERAYKIKRPVRMPFVDQRSPARRAELCAEELRLNRRFAPELYLGVRPIVRVDGRLRIGGAGAVVEHAVCMRRFDRREELDRLVGAGTVTAAELVRFGEELAALQAGLQRAPAGSSWATAAEVRALVLANLDQCVRASTAVGAAEEVGALRTPLLARLDALETRLADRHAGGFVRECHGDLHTRNIVRHGGRLLAFDCVEFEPAFRWIDVADDAAFLAADLAALGARRLAHAFLQAWLAASGDWPAARLQPLYQAHRALVRAKVVALSAAETATAADVLRRRHAAYVAHAARMLADARPAVLLMCGVSGSGKTWLAERIAPALGALHLRSDIERKRRAGLAPGQRSGSALESGLYTASATADVYGHLLDCTRDVLAGGYPAIVDATFLRPEDRRPWLELADALRVPLRLLLCHAPPAEIERRIETRLQAGRDASEADHRVLEWQRQRAVPPGGGEAAQAIAADTSVPDIVQQVLARLEADLGPGAGGRGP